MVIPCHSGCQQVSHAFTRSNLHFLPLWPDMDVETLTNLAADRFYDVREGDSVVSSKSVETGRVKQP
jgi:hypothetical protein